MATRERIGGHDGMTVYRTAGGIVKQADNDAEWEGLLREWEMLKLMNGAFAPEQTGGNEVERFTIQEDCGDALSLVPPATLEPDWLMREFIGMVTYMRGKDLRHGDLTPPNISALRGSVYALDWMESHFLNEPAPPKRTTSDSWQLMKTYSELTQDPRRIARRWSAILQDLGAAGLEDLPLSGKTFVDLGCFEGWFPALAAAELMEALGVDMNGASIRTAREIFPGPIFYEIDIEPWVAKWMHELGRRWDVVTMLSTWPYLVQQGTWEHALETLRTVISQSDVLYFETQIAGDGPGPEHLKSKLDVAKLLTDAGAEQLTPILDIEIEGRNATRTLWSVR